MRNTELSERKKAILSAIVKLYITSGEPIGSKMLCEILENAPSSATLRNEMNALCDLGLLSQPHTSAGRIPTTDGYRLYVNTLMDKPEVSEDIKKSIDENLGFSNCDPEKLPEKAVETLSKLTGLPVFSAKISDAGVTLKRIELLPMGKSSAMLIIITSDGRSRSRLCHMNSTLTSALISEFDRLITRRVLNMDLELLSPATMQSITVQSGLNILNLMPLITALFQMVQDIKNSCFNLKGASNFFTMGLDRASADKISTLLNHHDTLMSLISKNAQPISVVFGSDTEYSALQPSCIILARYGIPGRDIGCIGIIGPTRLSYEKILPSIEYTVDKINELLSNTLKDMEEV